MAAAAVRHPDTCLLIGARGRPRRPGAGSAGDEGGAKGVSGEVP